MLIGAVSAELQIPIETLRYYDRIGLVSPLRQSGVRRYSQEDVQKLAAIMKMKRLMFSLEEIKAILSMDAQVNKSLKEAHPDEKAVSTLLEQVRAKHREVESLEQSIKDVKAELARLMAKIETVIQEGE